MLQEVHEPCMERGTRLSARSPAPQSKSTAQTTFPFWFFNPNRGGTAFPRVEMLPRPRRLMNKATKTLESETGVPNNASGD